MKTRIGIVTFICGLTLTLNAQVESKKPVSAKTFGTNKILAKAPKKILLSQFSLIFKTSEWVAQGDALNGVGIASFLELDEDLAQEITDEAFQYTKDQWIAKGYEVITYDETKVKANKVFVKESGKEKIAVTDGAIEKVVPKRASKGDATLKVSARGLKAMQYNSANPMIQFKFEQEYFGKEEVVQLNFITGFGFADTKGFSTSTSNNVQVNSNLDCGNYGGVPAMVYRNIKLKTASILFNSHNLKYKGNEWISNVDQKDELYGSSVRYTLNPEAYKKACMAMLKPFIDEMIDAYETELAKYKK